MDLDNENKPYISSEYTPIQGVPTHVLKYGLIDPENPVLTLIIPG